MRKLTPLLLLLLPAVAVAEEAAQAPSEDGVGMQTVIVSILGLVTTVAIPFLMSWLKDKFDVEAEKAEIDKSKSLAEQKNFFIDKRLIPFAISTAEHWLITQMPSLIADLTDDDSKFSWEHHLEELKDYVKEQVLKKFAAENMDVVEYLGKGVLEDIINRQAVKLAAKLPEPVRKLLPDDKVEAIGDKLSGMLIERGLKLLG